MTLVQLQYVLAVAEHKNFTQAAVKSFVTQPTLSMQIQKLESELNVEIFDRKTHPIKITAIGEKIIEQAKIILKESKKMKHLVDEQRVSLSGEFTLGIIPTILPSLVPLFYKTFQKKYPKTKLIIKELKTEEILHNLKDGSLDFAVAAIPLSDEHIRETSLYYEPLVGYIPAEHPLSKVKKLSVDDITTAKMLLLQEGHCFRNNVLSLCDPSLPSKTAHLDIESASFSALMKMADEGYGITLLPSLFTEDLSKERMQNVKQFTDPAPTREVGLIYHQSQLRTSFIDEFSALIKSILRGKIYLEDNNNTTLPSISIS